MNHDICVQLRERGEEVAATYIERLGQRFVDQEQMCLILERAYSQQQKVWAAAIARADRYEKALREIACANDPDDPCTCQCQTECSYGIARIALAEEKKE